VPNHMAASLQNPWWRDVADFDESGQRFRQVADKHFAKSRTAGSIEFRQPGCCYG
jgi:maltooligosyltrehalose synthase